MPEIQLFIIFCACLVITIAEGFITIKSLKGGKNDSVFPILMIPISSDMQDIEFIVRELIYKVAQHEIRTEVILINFGADNETLKILTRLMDDCCKYRIIEAD